MITQEMLGKYKYVGGTSDKFWHIIHDRSRNVCVAKWGRNGRPPQGTKEYSMEQARKKVREKIKKGYVKVDGSLEHIGSNAIAFITSVL